MQKFTLKLLAFTTLISIVFGSIIYSTSIFIHTNWVWGSIAFFTVLSWTSFFIVFKAKEMEHNKFIGRFLFVTIFRIIISGLFIAIYLIINAERDKAFVVSILLLYLFYTLFEIYHLVTKLRAEKYTPVEHTNG